MPASIERQAAQPVGLGGEQLVEPLHLGLLLRHCQPHNGRPGNCHPGLTGTARAETSGAHALAHLSPLPQGARRPRQAKESAGSLLRFLLLLLVFAWALRSFVVAPFSIPSGSMLPTLYIGDYLMVAKWPYGYSRYSFPFGFPPIEGRLFANLPKPRRCRRVPPSDAKMRI